MVEGLRDHAQLRRDVVELLKGHGAVAVLVVVAEDATQQLRCRRVALTHGRACLWECVMYWVGTG